MKENNDAILNQAYNALAEFNGNDAAIRRLKAIISYYKKGTKATCEEFEINDSTLSNWKNSFIREGLESLRKLKPLKKHLSDEYKLSLKKWLEANPSNTKEFIIKIYNDTGIQMKNSTANELIRKLKYYT